MRVFGKVKIQNKFAERFSKDKKWHTVIYDGMFVHYDRQGNKIVDIRIEIWGHTEDETWRFIKPGNWYYLDGTTITGIEESKITLSANIRRVLPGVYVDCTKIEDEFDDNDDIQMKVTKVNENEEIIEFETKDDGDAAVTAIDEVIGEMVGGSLEEDETF